MKKMFLLLLCCPVVLAAQSGITISGFSVKTGTPATVTFTVNWNKTSVDSAWVFVDYNDSGTMTRLPLLDITASAGRAYMVDGNDRGAWVVAGAAGAFSATVQLVPTCRDARPCVPTGACVYAIDYPPVGKYTAAYIIEFTGTPPFYLQFGEDDSRDTLEWTAQPPYTYTIPSGKTLASFTDASGASGFIDEKDRHTCATAADCNGDYCVCGTCMNVDANCYKDEYAYIAKPDWMSCPTDWSYTRSCPNPYSDDWPIYSPSPANRQWITDYCVAGTIQRRYSPCEAWQSCQYTPYYWNLCYLDVRNH